MDRLLASTIPVNVAVVASIFVTDEVVAVGDCPKEVKETAIPYPVPAEFVA